MNLEHRLSICADDYGMAPGIGLAIRELISQKRISATSCMTTSKYWPEEAPLLYPLTGRAEIGLHITLTDQRPLSDMPNLAPMGQFPTARTLFYKAIRGDIIVDEVVQEINAQIDSFSSRMNKSPDFLDGHHHVHQFPIIRNAVLHAWRQRFGGSSTWIRSCYEPINSILSSRTAVTKSLFLSQMGGALMRELQKNNVLHNHSFRGIYSLKTNQSYGMLFQKWTTSLPRGSLLMCHPGTVDNALFSADSMTYQREHEFNFLKSEAFLETLKSGGIVISALQGT